MRWPWGVPRLRCGKAYIVVRVAGHTQFHAMALSYRLFHGLAQGRIVRVSAVDDDPQELALLFVHRVFLVAVRRLTIDETRYS
ncbi:MAG: hypothetical protein MUC88_16825 [Planctomycetes bacterium]|nr:hypothetical protein [Planctomycetota bacterium]